MKTYSSIGDLIEPITENTTEICEKHNLPKRKIKGKEDYLECPQCALETHQERETNLAIKWTQESIKARTQSILKAQSIIIDDTLKEATFDNYKTEEPEAIRNKEQALQISREYYKGGKFNTILTGKAGTGKSHLAMSILKIVNEYSEPYRKCLFVSVDEMMRLIKSSFNDDGVWHTESRMVGLLASVDLLVLDDLGAETGSMHSSKTATDFTTRVLYGVANGRMNKPTIITTNLNSNELLKMYDSKLLSRLLKGTKGHTIIFKDISDKRFNYEF